MFKGATYLASCISAAAMTMAQPHVAPAARPPGGCALAPARPPADRQEFFRELIETYGGKEFANPPEVRPTSQATRYTLEVKYSDAVIAGCNVHLRSYNGKIVGDTIRAAPGQSIYLTVVNRLPPAEHEHPQGQLPHGDMPFSFNLTNLHTHGLHTAPQGQGGEEGDNVLLEIPPGGSQNYRIAIPATHAPGTFWYHPHVHGATAIQVSSGMAGALIIEGGQDALGGLDSIPAIAQASEKIFVLQQFSYATDGRIEMFDGPASRNWLGRGVMVNGQLAPVIRMRPGEVQRWRFIHAGVEDNIELSLDGHRLYEIAADGIALGRFVPWPAAEPIDGERSLLLGPGYRSDVLVQANLLPAGVTRQELFLRDLPLRGVNSMTTAMAALRLSKLGRAPTVNEVLQEQLEKPESIIARVIIEGTPVSMRLPSDADLKARVPTELKPITQEELSAAPGGRRTLHFAIRDSVCDQAGDCSPTECDSGDNCKTRFMINNRVFMPDRSPIQLKLGTASEWILAGNLMTHPFHIHVNPFQVERMEPDREGKPVRMWIWKDTLLLPPDESEVIVRSRYTVFTGRFVLHCHILGHEDQGMMELVEIVR